MSNETSTTKLLRNQAYFDACLSSSVIAIGYSEDLIMHHARPFDMARGEADHITDFVCETFACVHGSHCLEHINDPATSLSEWWQLIVEEGAFHCPKLRVEPPASISAQAFEIICGGIER